MGSIRSNTKVPYFVDTSVVAPPDNRTPAANELMPHADLAVNDFHPNMSILQVDQCVHAAPKSQCPTEYDTLYRFDSGSWMINPAFQSTPTRAITSAFDFPILAQQ